MNIKTFLIISATVLRVFRLVRFCSTRIVRFFCRGREAT